MQEPEDEIYEIFNDLHRDMSELKVGLATLQRVLTEIVPYDLAKAKKGLAGGSEDLRKILGALLTQPDEYPQQTDGCDR